MTAYVCLYVAAIKARNIDPPSPLSSLFVRVAFFAKNRTNSVQSKNRKEEKTGETNSISGRDHKEEAYGRKTAL